MIMLLLQRLSHGSDHQNGHTATLQDVSVFLALMQACILQCQLSWVGACQSAGHHTQVSTLHMHL